MNVHEVSSLAAEDLSRDAPDANFVVTDRGRVTARCSCWWTSGQGLQTPAPEAIGLIGHYAALDPHAGRQALDRACARLRAEGCTTAVGPMDGSTWGRYRFVTERGAQPAFLLEPDNPDQWPMDFVSFGFAPLATYHSAVASDLAAASAGAMELEDRLNARGITIRNLDPARIDRELRHLYTVSLVSFQDNFLYTPITEDEFCRRYRAILPMVRPELVSIAEHDRHPIGFLFAIPDALEPRGPNETVVVKSLAVLPHWRQAGVGKALLARTHGMARELGYRRAIHALMHDAGVSPMMSRQSAEVFRRYALFGKAL
jgi:GNAT superfamily N-acetyltransferase